MMGLILGYDILLQQITRLQLAPGGIFCNTIKLMLEGQKSALYQQEMLLESAKSYSTSCQQDMPHATSRICC